jgi:dolichol-phosphate mannosyltransferase
MGGVSIVVPVLNEKKNLKQLIYRISKSLKKIKKYEIIIVDDNSHDGTQELLIKLKKKFKKLTYIIRKNKKRDLSRSCIDGFAKSKYNLIVVMDGDLQHDSKDIYRLYTTLLHDNLDVVIGDRFLLSRKNRGLKIHRHFLSILITFIVNSILGFKTKDPMSGFFIFKKKIFERNKNYLYANGYKILLDLIYSSRNILKIKDIYIKFNIRFQGSSKVDLKMLYHLGFVIIAKFILRLKFKKIF